MRIRQDDGTGGGDIGSMTFAPQLEIVERHLADAVAKGAKVVVGGRRLDRDGLWFEPTVLVDVDHTMDVMTEETFGPVLPIMVVDGVEEAVRLANDSPVRPEQLGVDRGRAARRLGGQPPRRPATSASTTASSRYAITGLPFGGRQGVGHRPGARPEGLREFTATKSVMAARVNPSRELWWFPVPPGMDRLGIASLRLRFGSDLRTKLRRSGRPARG